MVVENEEIAGGRATWFTTLTWFDQDTISPEMVRTFDINSYCVADKTFLCRANVRPPPAPLQSNLRMPASDMLEIVKFLSTFGSMVRSEFVDDPGLGAPSVFWRQSYSTSRAWPRVLFFGFRSEVERDGSELRDGHYGILTQDKAVVRIELQLRGRVFSDWRQVATRGELGNFIKTMVILWYRLFGSLTIWR